MTRGHDDPRKRAESPCECSAEGYCPHYRREVRGREWHVSRQRSHLATVLRLGWLVQLAGAEWRSRRGENPAAASQAPAAQVAPAQVPVVAPVVQIARPKSALPDRPACKHMGRRVRLGDGSVKTRKCALG